MSEEDTQYPAIKLSTVDAVRKRPGMYFGAKNSLALNVAIYELVANAVDLFLAGLATKVNVRIEDNVIFVSDDGPGLPFDEIPPKSGYSSLAEYYFLEHHDSPTADGHAPHIHIMGGGLGMVIINASSKYIKVKSSNGSYTWTQSFGEGKTLGPPAKVTSKTDSGTTFELLLDEQVFGSHKPDLFDLRKTLFELAHFYPGLIVEFQEEIFIARNGLLDLACIHYTNLPTYLRADKPPIKYFFEGVLDGVQVQVAAIGQAESQTEFLSWVNGSFTAEGGQHVEGLSEALKPVSWMPKLALVHVIMHQPSFAGPCKDALTSKVVKAAVKNLIANSLKEFIKENIEDD